MSRGRLASLGNCWAGLSIGTRKSGFRVFLESKRRVARHSPAATTPPIMTPLLPSLLANGLPLADFGNYGIGPFLVPTAGMAFVLGIILIATIEKLQKERLRHETIRQALEKGQPLPPELIEGKVRNHPRDDRRSGMIAIAVGIGLFVLLREVAGHDGVEWVGLIPGLVGVALLLNWALERGGKNDQPRP
jgi:hypothetical protein